MSLFMFFFLMIRRPPISTRTDTLFPYTTLFRSMAQDFTAAFNVGEDSRHINTVDADGIALAAVKGLYELVRERSEEHTSELQSLMRISYAVFCLKKKKKNKQKHKPK